MLLLGRSNVAGMNASANVSSSRHNEFADALVHLHQGGEVRKQFTEAENTASVAEAEAQLLAGLQSRSVCDAELARPSQKLPHAPTLTSEQFGPSSSPQSHTAEYVPEHISSQTSLIQRQLYQQQQQQQMQHQQQQRHQAQMALQQHQAQAEAQQQQFYQRQIRELQQQQLQLQLQQQHEQQQAHAQQQRRLHQQLQGVHPHPHPPAHAQPLQVLGLVQARNGTVVQRLQKGNRSISSQFRGVSLTTKGGRWRVQIGFNARRVSVGHFEIERDAAIAYDRVARHLLGPSCALNFPDTAFADADCSEAVNLAVAEAVFSAQLPRAGGTGGGGVGGGGGVHGGVVTTARVLSTESASPGLTRGGAEEEGVPAGSDTPASVTSAHSPAAIASGGAGGGASSVPARGRPRSATALVAPSVSFSAPAARHRAGGAYRCGFVSQPIAPWPATALGQAPAAPLHAQQSFLQQQFALHPQHHVQSQMQQMQMQQQQQQQQHWLVQSGQLQGGLSLQRPHFGGIYEPISGQALAGADTTNV